MGISTYFLVGLVVAVVYTIYEAIFWNERPTLRWVELVIFGICVVLWPILALDMLNQCYRRL